ncbi:RNase H family protein [Aestuariimicrobium ganziense]|uniref:RNase H family protein n=1 Tax=Aestuariimicrobium ganziense TaxID=2773677 RepID=UPI001942D99B|nr:RNase H family protein [Aestuariimicrobium ganziense]
MITAAADGSSLSNPGPAGWAWYVDDPRGAAGGWAHGTNNMGELMAVLDLLQQTADVDEPLHVLCDSQYVINCATKWIPGWKRRGWRKADGKPVLNVELLRELDAALAGRRVSFEWVKGHAGHELNEAADLRARAVATAFRDGAEPETGPGWAGASSPAREIAFAPTPKPEPEPDLFSLDEPPAGVDQPVDQGAPAGGESLVEERAPASVPKPTPIDPDHPVLALERRLLDDDVRTDRTALEQLLHALFVEHTASGGILTRNRAVLGLGPLGLTPRLEVMGIDELGAGLVSLRYRLTLGSRVTLRHSLWQQGGPQGWQLRFHQGTPAR